MQKMYQVFGDKAQSRRDALADPRGAKKISNEHRQSVSGLCCRPYSDLDSILRGIWWILCAGAMWNQMPSRSNRKKPANYRKASSETRHEVVPSEATTRLATGKRTNFFARIKRYRRVSTRYDRRPDTYMGFATLSALTDWIKFDFVHTH